MTVVADRREPMWRSIGITDYDGTPSPPTEYDGNPDWTFPIWTYPSTEERLARYRAEVAYVRALVRRELAS